MKKLLLLGPALLLMIGLVVGVKIYAAHTVETKLRSATERIKKQADVDFQDVEVQLFGLNLVVNGVDVALPTGQKLHIAAVVVHDIDIKNKPPLHARVELRDFVVAVNEENFGHEFESLHELGFAVLQGNLNLDYAYDPAAKTLVLRDFQAVLPGVARVEASVALSGFDLEKAKALDFDDLVIDSLRFHYDDQALLRTMVLETQKTEQEIVGFLVDGLREDMERAKARNQLEAVKTMQELITFIETPQGLVVDVALERQVSVQQIMLARKITEILKRFSIKVEAVG